MPTFTWASVWRVLRWSPPLQQVRRRCCCCCWSAGSWPNRRIERTQARRRAARQGSKRRAVPQRWHVWGAPSLPSASQMPPCHKCHAFGYCTLKRFFPSICIHAVSVPAYNFRLIHGVTVTSLCPQHLSPPYCRYTITIQQQCKVVNLRTLAKCCVHQSIHSLRIT